MCKLLTNGIQIKGVLSTCKLRLIGHPYCHWYEMVRYLENLTEFETSWGEWQYIDLLTSNIILSAIISEINYVSFSNKEI